MRFITWVENRLESLKRISNDFFLNENSNPEANYISLNKPLVTEVNAFLSREGMKCRYTQEGLVEVINVLSTYQEEGKSLFPQMYIVDDLSMFARILSPSKFHKIGADEKNSQTMLEAVKKCAPLTQEGWAIYIWRKNQTFEYGVFKSGTSILSVPAAEIILSTDAPLKPAVLVHQTSGKVVEVKGSNRNSIIASFSSNGKIEHSPIDHQAKCVECIIEHVPQELQDQARNFFRRLFMDIMQNGHGTLISIVDHSFNELPNLLKDGIKFDEKIDIISAIKDLVNNESLTANSAIDGYFSLLKGMLSSDGVTIFSNDGSIIGYNVFVSYTTVSPHRERFGGSRKRTYNNLMSNLDDKLIAVFVQSQDGAIQFARHEK
jgi:hypothetical protein